MLSPVMERKNKYAYRSRISEAKFRLLVKCFAFDLDATRTAVMVNVNRNTVNRYMRLIRLHIAKHSRPPSGIVELRVGEPAVKEQRIETGRGERRRKARIVGIFIRKGVVYIETVPAAFKTKIQSVMRGKSDAGDLKSMASWRGYDAVADFSTKKLLHLTRTPEKAARGHDESGIVEAFWAFLRFHMRQFKGVPLSTFLLHLKECEFRFNNRYGNLYEKLLVFLRKHPLN